ncbi:MAG: hypothetical protein ACPLY7_01355 [Microgenomates group bacterium]
MNGQRDIYQFLDIKEIKGNTLLLKDNSLRKILEVSALNFFLKSKEEQDAILYNFHNFLNSLEFSIQIYIFSRKTNILSYSKKLKELEEKQTNDLLLLQLKEYENFITNLVQTGEIMTKRFFVIVPFYFAGLEVVSRVQQQKEKIDPLEFERGKKQLKERSEFVAFGLTKCGLKVRELNNKELVELFWSLYHQEESEVGFLPAIPPEFS